MNYACSIVLEAVYLLSDTTFYAVRLPRLLLIITSHGSHKDCGSCGFGNIWPNIYCSFWEIAGFQVR